MIIDSHVHFPAGCERENAPGRRLVRSALPYGIGACVVSHLFGERMGADLHFPVSEGIHAANCLAAREVSRNPGRLHFMGYINPQNPDWMQEFEWCLAHGACGIKLWVSLKDSRGSLGNTVSVLRSAATAGKAVYLHVFNRTGGNLPGEITMAELAELAQTVPDCRMIAGHTGGNWRKSAELIARCPDNVWMETGGSNPDFGMVDGILKFCPPERLIYGSDGPGRAFFPQIWKIMESALSPADRERVFLRNAMHLLNLPHPPAIDALPAKSRRVPGPSATDFCCFCGNYPFEARPDITPDALESLLEKEGVRKAYAADFGAIFSGGSYDSNRTFLTACRHLSRVKPLAVIHPRNPNRERLLKEIESAPAWKGIWLSPAFHTWRLDASAHAEFLRRCAAVGKPLFINCGFYEPRFFSPELPFREVSDDELRAFLREIAPVSRIIQGKLPLADAGGFPNVLWCATQLTDYGHALSDAMRRYPTPRLVRGSEFPFRHIRETLAAARFRM